MNIKYSAITTALSLAVVSGLANAAIVSTWDYTTQLKFGTGNNGGDAAVFDDGGNSGVTFNSESELSWGLGSSFTSNGITANDGGRSALTIGNIVNDKTLQGGAATTSSVNTSSLNSIPNPFDGELGFGNTLTHWNNVVDGSSKILTEGTFIDTLTLTPILPTSLAGDPITDPVIPTLTFDFGFKETYNVTPCEAGVGGKCDDIWAIRALSAADLTQHFEYLGQEYRITTFVYEIDLSGITDLNDLDPVVLAASATELELLTPAQCAAAGYTGELCVGLMTKEKQTNSIGFAFSVAAVPVPAAVWLFGTALLGFVGYTRKKASKA